MNIIKGESIAQALESWGIRADFIRFFVTPSNIKYFFKLQKPEQTPRVLKLGQTLEAWSGAKMNCTASNGFFIISTPAPERRTVWAVDFKLKTAPPFSVIFGEDEEGEKITKTLEQLTHLLIAGTTGSGKSICINSIITGLACYNSPEELELWLFDPKQVEIAQFAELPHTAATITDADEAAAALLELVEIMEGRYKQLQELGRAKNSGEFKKIVVVVDELADLILTNKETKKYLIRLLQKGRAAGIHCILATQSPRASVLDGLLLANLPSRLALTCASARESVLILGHKGAEALGGRGDAILKTADCTTEKRIQCAYISKKQIAKLTNG